MYTFQYIFKGKKKKVRLRMIDQPQIFKKKNYFKRMNITLNM